MEMAIDRFNSLQRQVSRAPSAETVTRPDPFHTSSMRDLRFHIPPVPVSRREILRSEQVDRSRMMGSTALHTIKSINCCLAAFVGILDLAASNPISAITFLSISALYGYAAYSSNKPNDQLSS